MVLLHPRMGSVLCVAGVLGALTLGLLLSHPDDASADAASDALQQQVDETNAKIAALRQEISQLQSQLTTTASQKQTLSNAIKSLNLNIQKLQKSITLTQTQIAQKDKQINVLATTISTTTSAIERSRTEVGNSLRQLDMLDDEPVILTMLGEGTLSSFFDQATTLQALRSGLQGKIYKLSSLKNNLVSAKSSTEQKREELGNLQEGLSDQKQGLNVTLSAQDKLLAETKNKESTYQALLAQKRAQEAAFLADLQKFEAQLNLQHVGAGSIPKATAGILSWPLDAIRITQYFGNTSFATQNPQIYGNKGHNAIDMAASLGTPVKSARQGVIEGTGNTDLQKGCYSYGKWVFIKHDNGLSTLYAHLSIIKVTPGQTVQMGDVIGYSGNTGYSTGPHLHFGVYATVGSKIVKFTSSIGCKNVEVPVADVTAYLNPLSYLPPLP